MKLKEYGYTDYFENAAAQHAHLNPARIICVRREQYELITQEGEIPARLRGALRRELAQSGDFPVVGDFVLIHPEFGQEATIERILPRRTQFSRSNYMKHREEAIAANFDDVCIVTSLNHDFNLRRCERYLAAAWQSGARPCVLLTKADLTQDAAPQIQAVQAIAPGVPVFALSAKSSEGMREVREYLTAGRTVVFIGSSGVGKSSLVNALAGEELMAVSAIREDDSKGRHTTTHRELIFLPGGLMVIDTPGLRELGLWDAQQGLDEAFADVRQWMQACRFSDCRHNGEPGCAVQAAIDTGELSQERWDSYRRLQRENLYYEDKAAYFKEKKKLFTRISTDNKKRKR